MSTTSSLESRVGLLEREQVTAEIATIYDKLLAERGVVPNMFKALANVPGLAIGFASLLKPLMSDAELPALYKELVATHIAWLNDCEYCVSSHRYLAKLRGATPEQIAAIENFEAGPFSEREKAGFRYAVQLHAGGNAIDDAAWKAVSSHFTQNELLELTAVAAAFEFFPRFNSSLRIPVTSLPEGY